MANHKTNRLKAADSFKLLTFIKARFIESGLTDAEFLPLAEKETGLTLTVGNITHGRVNLEIPANIRPGIKITRGPTAERITKLETDVAAIKAFLNAQLDARLP